MSKGDFLQRLLQILLAFAFSLVEFSLVSLYIMALPTQISYLLLWPYFGGSVPVVCK
jgi:hypothetical protein